MNVSDRFWSKVAIEGPDDCWEWQAFCDADGYGRFRIAGRSAKANRTAYELMVGEIPTGIHVLHTCDNPPCCNPKHLYLGTDRDNHNDKLRRGRDRHPKGEEHGRAKLTETQIREIRANYVPRKTTHSSIAEQYGVHKETIARILQGKAWSHL